MFLSANKRIFYKLIHNYRKILVNNDVPIFRTYSTPNKVDETVLEKYVKVLQNEYDSLSSRNLLNDTTENRLKQLSPIIHILEERNRMQEHLSNLNELLKEDDNEMKKLAEDEKETYKEKLLIINNELVQSLIPKDIRDFCDSIVLEINAGVGGQEAMLFANELFDMYLNFAEYKGWSCEIAEFDTTDIGGIRHASAFINGADVFRYFKYEAGVHRVQRIPMTEKGGRVHTSTVSVVALPQPRDIDVTIADKDLRIETKRASGAGGQHVNTTDSAVRIVHLPTGVAVECQVDRSQIKNKQIAMQRLRAKLYEEQLREQLSESEATRKAQVRSNFRNEKIRTYNFSQDRITDHRLQGSNMHNLKNFLLGNEQLEQLIDRLYDLDKYEKLMEVLNSV